MVDKQELHGENIYHIRVKGNLDEKWADWFEGFVMTSRDGGETLLCGAVVDQAALHGVLGKICGLGLSLPQQELSKARAMSRMRRSLWRQWETAILLQGEDQVG